MRRMVQRARAQIAGVAANPRLFMLHVLRGLVESGERTLGAIATMLSPIRSRKELKRRARERSQSSARWFTADERALIDALARLIVPSDETGPGADQMVAPSATEALDDLAKRSPSRQTLYARGLLALDRVARSDRVKFVERSPEEQLRVLAFVDQLHRAWAGSTSGRGKIKNKIDVLYRKWSGAFPAVELWPQLIRDVQQVFYSHRVSWDWLGYDGPPMPDGYPRLERRR